MSDDKVKKFLELVKSVDKEYNSIYQFSKKPIDENNPDAIAERLARSSEYLTITGRLESQAKYIRTVERQTARIENPEANKEEMEYEVAEAQRRVDSCDRLNAAITHQIGALRSLLSWWKEDRNASRNAPNPRQ